MQRQSVRHQTLNDKTLESSQSQLITQTQYLQNASQHSQGKQCPSIRSSSKLQAKQTDYDISASSRSTEHENNIQVLHSKLHSETENILKWKVSTELEMSQKERKLIETEEIVERQRKNLFELQMHSEQLSQRLQEELKNREDLSSKIENTRNICNIIRDHCNKLTTTLNVCVDEKENLKTAYTQQKKEIEQLQEEYKKIDLSFKTEVEQLEELVREERSQRNKIIAEANAMHTILNEKIEELDKNNNDEREKCNRMNQQLAQYLEKMKVLETKDEENINLLSSFKKQVLDLESQIVVQKEKFELDIKETLAIIEQERLRSALLQKQYAEAQDNLQQMMVTKDDLFSENTVLKETVENLEISKHKLNEDLLKTGVEHKILLEERDRILSELKALEESDVKLQALKIEYENIVLENQMAVNELKETHDKLMIIENSNREKESELKAYADENMKLKDKNSCCNDSLNSLAEKLKDSELLEHERKQKILFLEKEIGVLRSQLAALESNSAINTSELTALIEEGRTESMRKDNEMKALTNELERLEMCILQLKDKEKDNLEQIRKMEEENENVKKSVDSEHEKVNALNDRIIMESGKNEELSKNLEDIKIQSSERAKIIESFKLEKEELENKLLHLQGTLEKISEERNDFEKKFLDVVKEKDGILFKSDSEIKEMVGVLEKYKRECDETVSQKEAIIIKLNGNIEEIRKTKEHLEEQVMKLQKENNTSLRKIADLDKEKDIIEKTLQVKVMDLELKLTAKEKEMAEKEVALLKNEVRKSPYSEKVFRSPSKMNSLGMGDKNVMLTPKSGISPIPAQLTSTPRQNPSILKEPNTPGANKKQVTFQEDTSDTDASSVDAMIIDNSDLISRFEALERGVKMMTPLRVLPSPKNRKRMEQKKAGLHLKNEENSPEFGTKKARMMRNKLMNEGIHLKGKPYQESDLKKLLKTKHSDLEMGRNTGLDLDELFEMVED